MPLALFALATLIFGATFMLWLWAVADAATSHVLVPQKQSTTLMASGFVYVLVYVAVVLGFVVTHSMGRGPGAIILVPHILAMAAMFYGLWLTAKQLTALKHNGPPPFLGTLGRFFMLWYFPIGIWFIQPTVRQRLGGVSA